MPNVGFYELSVGMIRTFLGILPSRTFWTIQSHSNGIYLSHFDEACLDYNMNATVEQNMVGPPLRKSWRQADKKGTRIVAGEIITNSPAVTSQMMDTNNLISEHEWIWWKIVRNSTNLFSPGKISLNVRATTFNQSQSHLNQLILHWNSICSKWSERKEMKIVKEL